MPTSAPPTVEDLSVLAFRVPTDEPESDGTLAWDATTAVVVEATGGGETGIGWTYGAVAVARTVDDLLASVVRGTSVLDVPRAWHAMVRAIRNQGRPGVASMAIAAVDCALWDLKARVLGVSLAGLLGRVRDAVDVYGSGGFTSYDERRLASQLAGWVEEGIPRVKMKVGREPDADPRRVQVARRAIGTDAALFVDANGAYDAKQALAEAERFAAEGVTWFEEPVSSDDLLGLHLVRGRVPAGMEVTAGEYGYDLFAFRRMLEAGAVDVLQADATRCAGITGFLGVGALCHAWNVPLSAHTAPNLHVHVACAVPALRHIEWFHDHVEVERLLFDGTLEPREGRLEPDPSRPGNGLALKRSDARALQVHGG